MDLIHTEPNGLILDALLSDTIPLNVPIGLQRTIDSKAHPKKDRATGDFTHHVAPAHITVYKLYTLPPQFQGRRRRAPLEPDKTPNPNLADDNRDPRRTASPSAALRPFSGSGHHALPHLALPPHLDSATTGRVEAFSPKKLPVVPLLHTYRFIFLFHGLSLSTSSPIEHPRLPHPTVLSLPARAILAARS